MTKKNYESPWTEAVRMDENTIICQSFSGAGAADLTENTEIDIFA